MNSKPARASLPIKVNVRGMLTLIAAVLLILPLLTIVMRVSFASTENWIHYRQFLLADSIWNTTILASMTLLLSGIIGVALAVLVVFFDFPGRGIMKWLFYLPLTIPPYIAAYVFSGMLGYTGIIQKTLRSSGIAVQPATLDIMNLQGAILIYTMTLYPYVYGAIRTFLERHSAGLIESARLLGLGPIRLVLRVILPLVRVPLTGGLMLLLMEVLSDYGVVRYFNLSTVSTLIFNSWFGLGDPSIAIRLSFGVMSLVVLLLFAEHLFQGRRRYHLGSGRGRPVIAVPLRGLTRFFASAGSILFLTITFLIPVAQLAHWSWLAWPKVQLENIVELVLSTTWVSLVSGLTILFISVFFAHSERDLNPFWRKTVSKIVQLGYSIPGAVIAIGTISLFVALDGLLFPLYQVINPDSRRLILSTSLVMLLLAFTVRYLAVGYNSTHSGFAKIGSAFSEAARTLGYSKTTALIRVELPMLKNALLSGLILTWIDISKELPLTLLLRPFNFNTLASRVYEYANDERIHEASVPALILITLSLIGIAGLTQLQTKNKTDR